MNYARLLTTFTTAATVALTVGCGSTVKIPDRKLLAGESLTAPLTFEACDAQGFRVWQNTPINRQAIARRSNSVEEYRGHIIEYYDTSYSKVIAALAALAGASSGIKAAVGFGIMGYVGGKEIEKHLSPAQLVQLRSCKNHLDQVPAVRQDLSPYREPQRRRYNSIWGENGWTYDPEDNVLALN